MLSSDEDSFKQEPGRVPASQSPRSFLETEGKRVDAAQMPAVWTKI